MNSDHRVCLRIFLVFCHSNHCWHKVTVYSIPIREFAQTEYQNKNKNQKKKKIENQTEIGIGIGVFSLFI